jgi:hypothetical protein
LGIPPSELQPVEDIISVATLLCQRSLASEPLWFALLDKFMKLQRTFKTSPTTSNTATTSTSTNDRRNDRSDAKSKAASSLPSNEKVYRMNQPIHNLILQQQPAY